MISVLIPAYNYSIVELVKELHEQLTNCKLQFEIICLEDGSDKSFVNHNSTIKNLSNTSIILSTINKGRIKSRQLLSESAKYEWLLFLDADVMPKSKDFISNYITLLNLKHEVIYGGFAYSNIPPSKDRILRWKYGKTFEEVDAKKRNLNAYRLIISANFLIKKNIFNNLNSKININSYGLDNYFAALLKQNNISVLHINNESYHFGIEKNVIFLNKVEEAINTLLHLLYENKIFTHNNKLLSIFFKAKRFKINIPLAHLYKKFNTRIKSNLLSHNPNMLLLQLYKISYMCYIDLNKKSYNE